MSLLPMLLRSMRPSSMMEHHLRMMRQMENVMSSAFPTYPAFHVEWHDPRYEARSNAPFSVKLDVKNFAPKEITVKTIDDSIIVEGKHEEESKEQGLITRHFIKTFNLPEGYEPEDVVSSLSPDGVLTISAPNKALEEPKGEREVPISLEGEEKAKLKN